MTTTWVQRLGARLIPPKRGRVPLRLRWASRIESWPPRLWLGLQVAALLPALGPGLTLLLAALLGAGVLRARHWTAHAGWLPAAALCTGIATFLTGYLSVLVAGAAMACALRAFRSEGSRQRPPRRLAEHAMRCLQRGALVKCGYALALMLCLLVAGLR